MMRLRGLAGVLAAIGLTVIIGGRALPADSATTFTVNTAGDAADLNLADSACDTSATAGLQCTLRAAIQEANDTAGLDTINFAIGSGQVTIDINASGLGALPAITDAAVIDGTTQPGYNAGAPTPMIELKGTLVVGTQEILSIASVAASTVKGLAITDSGGNGIALQQGSGHLLRGNYVGLRLDGTTVLGNSATGVFVSSSASSVTIGGSTAAERNVISGNTDDGIDLFKSSNNIITGNYIGTSASGTTDRGNGDDGIVLGAPGGNNTVGGTGSLGNVISGNNGTGVVITGITNVLKGNIIGANAAGTAAIANSIGGIHVFGTSANGNTIGGAGADGNVISGNTLSVGVAIEGGTGNVVKGNQIGTVNGSTALPNAIGLHIADAATSTTIGGNATSDRNIISGNVTDGILITGATSTSIKGNYIGLGASGTLDLGNGGSGIAIDTGASSVTIGGNTTAQRNVISGNDVHGVRITGGTTITIVNNYIGTDAAGTLDRGNSSDGIRIEGSTVSNTVLGTAAANEGNVISGNNSDGIELLNDVSGVEIMGNRIGTSANGLSDLGNTTNGIRLDGNNNQVELNVISGNNGDGMDIQGGSTGNVVVSNKIGVGADSTTPIGNSLNAIQIQGDSDNNNIGSTNEFGANIIAYSGSGDGIAITSSGQGNLIGVNSIHSNGALGIDLNDDGVANANDIGAPPAVMPDLDAGANNLQNFPAMLAAFRTGLNAGVVYRLDSTPSTAFTMRFYHSTACDASGNGEGQTYIGSFVQVTDPNGLAIGSPQFAVHVPPGAFVTATATGPGNNTSEFSNCIPMNGYVVNSNADPGDGTCDGTCTLRDAILNTNAVAGLDRIQFNITPSGTKTISPASPLPTITDPVIIDGQTQPGFAGTPIIEIDGTNAGDNADGLVITAGNSTVKGLVINRFTSIGLASSDGIILHTGGNNVIQGNYIGTNLAGTAASINRGSGIVVASANNTIGGSGVGVGNLLSGNRHGEATEEAASGGVKIVGASATGNVVLGNTIGTNAAATAKIANVHGVLIENANGNTIGGSQMGAENVISGGFRPGIALDNADNNLIENNYIGTDSSGTLDLDNNEAGIRILPDSENNTFRNNVIAFNVQGAEVTGGNGNRFTENSFHSVVNMTLDLLDDNIHNPNDLRDPDTGPNAMQNHAVLLLAINDTDQALVDGVLNSTPNTTFTLEYFYNASCPNPIRPPAAEYVATRQVTTSAQGGVAFSHAVARVGNYAPGSFLTATVTDPAGNTSEISRCTAVTTDADADGDPDTVDNCPLWPNPSQALPVWPVPAEDLDCDGFSAASEVTMGTDATRQCPVAGTPDAWPVDFNQSGNVNIADVTAFKPVFLQSVPPGPARFDLNASGAINIADVTLLKPFFLQSCTP